MQSPKGIAFPPHCFFLLKGWCVHLWPQTPHREVPALPSPLNPPHPRPGKIGRRKGWVGFLLSVLEGKQLLLKCVQGSRVYLKIS